MKVLLCVPDKLEKSVTRAGRTIYFAGCSGTIHRALHDRHCNRTSGTKGVRAGVGCVGLGRCWGWGGSEGGGRGGGGGGEWYDLQ